MTAKQALNVREIISTQRKYFLSHKTKDLSFRKKQLKKLRKKLLEREKDFFDALKKDLRKPEFETYGTELAQVKDEIDYALKNLEDWARPEKVKTALVSFPSKHYKYYEPYGVCLVIGAWNYPILLSLAPAIGAIAAGNCVLLKPSELAINTSNLLCEIINENFGPEYFKVIEGGPDTTRDILNEKLDYIFFTGSPRVGKIIMESATKYLTPVTLELGGKSPCIVDEDCDLKTSAKRVIFGKMLNGGQTCVAPDFVLVHKNVKESFLKHCAEVIDNRYGSVPLGHPDLCRIINKSHFQRLISYLEGSKIYTGGQYDEDNLMMAPTILTDMSWDDKIMQEEIFGPILPVLTFQNLDETIDLLNQKEKPLAAYYFSANKKKQQELIKKLHFGGGVINDTIFQFGNPELPVGGVGNSGMGRYHGKYSFDTFSHIKGVVKKPYIMDLDLRYPPYHGKLKWLRWIFKF